MHTGRLEAFSDGVLAIIITIMVLEMKVPHGGTGLADLKPVLPVFLSYMLSFAYIGIYWNNHHHMFQVTHHVRGGILWANLHLLFWLSLIPFVTGWMGENHFAPVPTALYGVVLLMAAIAYIILQGAILRAPGASPVLAAALGRDLKGKISPILYASAIGLSFVNRWIACAIYVLVALIWLVPDRRIERVVAGHERVPVGPARRHASGVSPADTRRHTRVCGYVGHRHLRRVGLVPLGGSAAPAAGDAVDGAGDGRGARPTAPQRRNHTHGSERYFQESCAVCDQSYLRRMRWMYINLRPA